MTKQVMFTSYMSAQRAFFITAIIAVVAFVIGIVIQVIITKKLKSVDSRAMANKLDKQIKLMGLYIIFLLILAIILFIMLIIYGYCATQVK